MQIHTTAYLDKREVSDALVIAYYKGQLVRPDLGHLETICQAPIHAGDFTGGLGELACVWGAEVEEKRIFLLGLGPEESCSPEKLRIAYGAVAKACFKYKCKSLNILLPELEYAPKAVVEGLLSAGYIFDLYKSEKEEPLEDITLIGKDALKAADRALRVMTSVNRARDLINGNADTVTPQFLAQYAKELSQEFPRITTEIKDKAWIQHENMGLLLAVAQGAKYDPQCIICSYKGRPVSDEHTVLVGKGITYDTGGLKLKSIEGMLSMRSDMSGAAVCLAVIEACAALSMPVNVTCLLPTCENAIGKDAYKLGDVYKSRAGITVEITNTDAEGRLILADALSYAVDAYNPTQLIDVGTLTGSMEIALGNSYMGLFSNSDFLAEALTSSGLHTHERLWRMPLCEEYREQLKSDVADCKNAATPKAGSIICALFLEQFVQNVPWAHIDMAPVAFAKDARGYLPKNGTAVGVRLLVDYLEKQQREQHDN